MRCSINPFRKTTEDGPTRLGKCATKLFSHREAMIRGRPGANHGNSFTGIEVLEQRSLSLDVQPGRR